MYRLAHISDVHLAPLPQVSWRELLSKRITGYVNWKLNRTHPHQSQILSGLIENMQKQRPDHIALTGDVINLGLDTEIANARTWLATLGKPEDVSVVCGNHDAYVPGSFERALASWQSYVAGDDGSPVRDSTDYPVLRRRGDLSIVMCNSACATQPFFATGNFSARQEEALARILTAEGEMGRCRVILIHHTPTDGTTSFHKRLIGARRFRKAVAGAGAEIVLHGHTHVDSLAMIGGRDGPVPVLGVPCAAQAPGGKHPAARYNLFSFDRGPKKSGAKWSITHEEFGYVPDLSGVRQIGQARLL